MSGTIKHEWNGSILTVTSDSGSSAADLRGPQGETGPRGPQGPPGVVYNEDGVTIVDLAPYATRDFVNNAIADSRVDLTPYAIKAEVKETYATKNYVSTEIAKVQLEGAGVDTSGFATKDELNDVEVKIDNQTLIRDADGKLQTAIGGYCNAGGGVNFVLHDIEWVPTGNWNYEGWYYADPIGNIGKPFVTDVLYHISMTFKDGDTIKYTTKFKGLVGSSATELEPYDDYKMPYNEHTSALKCYTDGTFDYSFKTSPEDFVEGDNSRIPSTLWDKWVLTDITIKAEGFEPIDGNFIPVDGVTILLNDEGKLTSAIRIEDGFLDITTYYTKDEIDNLLKNFTAGLPSSEEVQY